VIYQFDSHEELCEALKAFFRPHGEAEKLKAREEYYRNRLAQRPRLKSRRKVAGYFRRKKSPVTRHVRLIQFPEDEYSRERRVFTPPRIRPSRDALHRSWDGYEWSIV